ncbi:unnamed protein product, partial [Meganyctiphanes norvegica]
MDQQDTETYIQSFCLYFSKFLLVGWMSAEKIKPKKITTCTDIYFFRNFHLRNFILKTKNFRNYKRHSNGAMNDLKKISRWINYRTTVCMCTQMTRHISIRKDSVNLNNISASLGGHFKEMVTCYFYSVKLVKIYACNQHAPAWLTELIEHQTWRSVVYKLAEEFPDCLMLNFTIKLISDAGFQGEITSISTAAQQIEVFSRILKTSTTCFLNSPEDTRHKVVEEFAKMVCHGQHTFIYGQVMLQILSQEAKGGNNIRRLQQEITKYAINRAGHNVTPIQLALNGSMTHPRAHQALSPMLSRNALNPADITVLFKLYSSPDNPPIVDLIRIPQLLELLIDTLFKPGSKVNPEHKNKYIFLLAYSAAVYETPKKGNRARQVNRDDLKPTQQAIEKVHNICQGGKSAMELIAEISTLYQCIRFPVVSVGLVRWIECVVNEPSYFKLCTESTPTHLALLDEVVSIHHLLHQRVLTLLIELFESEQSDLEILVQLELRKMLLDRMVNLLSRGCVLPVMKYIKVCFTKGDTDISLIRYFVREVLEIISPPYTVEFVQLFLPLVENEEITGPMRINSDSDLVTEFIAHCKSNYIVIM